MKWVSTFSKLEKLARQRSSDGHFWHPYVVPTIEGQFMVSVVITWTNAYEEEDNVVLGGGNAIDACAESAVRGYILDGLIGDQHRSLANMDPVGAP